MNENPLAAHILEDFFDIFRQGLPLALVHDDEHGRGVSHVPAVRGGLDHFRLAPSLEGFDGREGPFDNPFLKGFVGRPLGHGDRYGAETFRYLGAEAGGAYFHTLQFLEVFHRGLGVEKAGAVGVNVKKLYVIQFLGAELPDKIIGHEGGRSAVRVTEGQVQGFHKGKTASGVSETGHSQVRDAAHHAIVALGGAGQGSSRENGDFHLSL